MDGFRRFRVYLAAEPYEIEALAGTSVTSPDYSFVDWLEATHLSVVSDGEIGELRVIAHKHPEDALPLLPLHTPIQVRDFYVAGESESSEEESGGTIVFDGVITKVHVVWDGTSETTEAVCHNNGDFLLHRIALHGQYRKSHSIEEGEWDAAPTDLSAAYGIASTDINLIDTPLVFNPQGQPNRSQQLYFLTDSTANGAVYLFDVPGRQQKSIPSGGGSPYTVESKPWTLSQAVAYLITLHQTTWAIDPSSFGDVPLGIFGVNGDPLINETNLEGKSLLEGLQILLSPYNYGFYVSPTLDPTSHKHRIYFYYKTNSQFTGTVRMSVRDTLAGASDANLLHADLIYDGASVVNTIASFGDHISVTTLAHTNPPTPGMGETPCPLLLKGWQSSDLVWVLNGDGTVNSFDVEFRKEYCHPDLISYGITGNPYGVGRMWLVNLGEIPDDILEDLGPDLANGVFTKRNSIDPRRLEKPDYYCRNSPGGQLHQEDIQVEMSFDGGTNWDIVERDWYRVLSDHIGIVFTNPLLEKLGIKFKNGDVSSGRTYWQALHDNKLRIRILCSLKSDERVSAIRSNVGGSLPLATERIFWNPNGFKKIIDNPPAHGSAYWTKFAPLAPAQDDSSALTTLTNLQASYTDRVIKSGTLVVVLGVFGEYHPGTQITSITNRVDFDPAPIILRAIYDLSNEHVQLVVDSRHVRSVLQGRPEYDRSREEARLGIRNLRAVQGAPQVPFVPGDSESYKTFIREGGTP